MKKILLALGLALALQPSQAGAMEQIKAVANNKWVAASTCALGGRYLQKYAGEALKDVFKIRPITTFQYTVNDEGKLVVSEVNAQIEAAAQAGKFNQYTSELPDDTTANILNFAAGVTNLKAISPLGVFALTNTFNFERSVETVAQGAKSWWKTLTPKRAALTSFYALAGIATAVAPQMLAKDNVWAQESLRFISRTYLRSKFLQWFSDEDGHKFNKNLADIFDIGLAAYYKA